MVGFWVRNSRPRLVARGYFYFYRSIVQRKVATGSNKATNPPPPPPPHSLLLCGHCRQPAQPGKSLLVRASCHEGWYCNTEHQFADWNCHKFLCKQRKKELKKEKERKESDAAINYLLLNPPVAARPTAADLFESLWRACTKGEVGRARKILLSGVDVNRQKQGGIPAFIACQNGHMPIAAHQPRRPAGQGFE